MGRARVWWLTGQYDNVMVATNQKADDSVKVIEQSYYSKLVRALQQIASGAEHADDIAIWALEDVGEESDYDPTPWCSRCGASVPKQCNCPKDAENE